MRNVILIIVSLFLVSCSGIKEDNVYGFWNFKDISSEGDHKITDIEAYSKVMKNARDNWYIQFNRDNTFVLNASTKMEGSFTFLDNKTLLISPEHKKNMQWKISKLTKDRLEFTQEDKQGFSEEVLVMNFSWYKK